MKKRIEVITGPMFCGKSEELIRRVRREIIANRNVVVVKPKRDTRGDSSKVTSRSDFSIDAICVERSVDILDYIDYDTVAIDEVQFFDGKLPTVASRLFNNGCRVILSGLDKDFFGEPFSVTCALMGYAHRVDKLTAICTQCGEEATETFYRKVASKSMFATNPIVVGDKDAYEARCIDCFMGRTTQDKE